MFYGKKVELKRFLAGDKVTLSYTGQKFEKMMRTKNKEHFCGSHLTDMLNIFPPSYQKTLRAYLNESQYLTLQLLLLLLQIQSILDFRFWIGRGINRLNISPSA